ncbi:MAG: tryptophan synthase subunit alpha [Elusimicrobia bacterium]|nr:tryptophan synthase subunit alpha [Elusimicrobiota bacterium]
MSKIQAAFKNKKLFIPYITVGDPDLNSTKNFILALQEAGAGLIELGIPFSDPVAEGPVIQRANERAMTNNITPEDIFKMLESIKHEIKVPLAFLTYLNPVLNYGYDNFFKRCTEVGVAGIITPDLPFEEHSEIKNFTDKHNIDIITLASPTSSNERLEKMAKAARGYIYLVSSMGVTGERNVITTDIKAITSEIKKYTDVPVAVGFGISTPEQARDISKAANGIIVGSAIVKLIEAHGTKAAPHIAAYTQNMVNAIT